MNGLLHLATAIGLVALLWLLLRAQKERDFLRDLLLNQQRLDGSRRLLVEAPAAFLQRFAAALGIPYEQQGRFLGTPSRLRSGPFTELFLHSGLSLIRCIEPDAANKLGAPLVVELQLTRPAADPSLVSHLIEALGDQVDVRFI